VKAFCRPDYIPGLVAIASDLKANLIGDDGERQREARYSLRYYLGL
jgi:hypothetical protein